MMQTCEYCRHAESYHNCFGHDDIPTDCAKIGCDCRQWNPAWFLTATVIHTPTAFVLQGLEADICAQGGTFEQCEQSFKRTVIGNYLLDKKNGKYPFIDFTPAPNNYWQLPRQNQIEYNFTRLFEASRLVK